MTATAEREKLRSAIANQQAAQRALEEAQLARANASSRWSAANSRIGEINAEIEDAEERAEDSTDDVISSLASGGDVLEKPRTRIDELRVALDAAEIESAKWRHAIDLAEQAVESRRRALEQAEFYRDSAARKVVAAEVNAAALLCHAEGLRSQLLDAQAKLAAVASSMEHGEAYARVANFVADSGWLIDSNWRNRPAGQQVRAMFNALKSDADAALKLN